MITKIVEILGGGRRKKKKKKTLLLCPKAINHTPSFLESWNSELQNLSFDILCIREGPPMQAFRI
jgi:hypothetical protein